MNELEEYFSEEHIKNYYLNKFKYNIAPGLDKINRRLFEKKLTLYTANIHRKVLKHNYNFSPYKEKLLLKRKDKLPRQISIPTIRDKVTLGIIKEILQSNFSDVLEYKLVQQIIQEIKNIRQQYNFIIKIDVKNFYPSINHKILKDTLRSRVGSSYILKLVDKAIKNPTIPEKDSPHKYKRSRKGIPQGLPISNILSNIYMAEIDKKYSKSVRLKYFRFVDDILILCLKEDEGEIRSNIINELKKISLRVNIDKVEFHNLDNEFSYLGYNFEGSCVSVREKSKLHLEDSLEKLFVDFKNSRYSNSNFFLWKLNLRITGCIRENIKYGWVFFFSQIDDISLLFHFDWLIKKLIKRFKLEKKIPQNKVKRFARVYHEILNNLDKTKYIPNFDQYTLDDKIEFLKSIEIEPPSWNDEYIINRYFYKIINSSIRELEKDIQNLRE